MRIAVDARELAPHPTGVGRYVREILQAWSDDPDAADCDVMLYLPEGPRGGTDPGGVWPEAPPPRGARITSVPLPSALSGTAWEQITLPLGIGRGADVLWAPAYSAPILTPLPTVVTVHDVSFCAHPEWFTRRDGLRRRWTCRTAAANAARVLTVSAFSKAEIVRWLGVAPAKVAVTPLGVSTRVRPANAPDRAGAAPLILHVGSLLNRRHLPDLVRAFAPIARTDARARLVLVGDNRTHPRQEPRQVARALGIAAAVETRPWVSDAELAALFGAATACAWLSTYEGFGLPPLEAMAAGVPVVACDTAVAREVYGDAAILVPAGAIDAVTGAFLALGDADTWRARRSAGLAQAARYAWSTTARLTLQALREAAA
jgi:glycosyltransferase involved in cell wall biosynthesis